MKLGNLVNKVKQVVDKRGGTDALKEDLEELQQVAKQKGSATDKAKDAAEALKDPGAPGQDQPQQKQKPQKQQQP